MIGIYITAWSRLPIEEVFVWVAVTYATTIVYEIVRRWHSSGKPARHAFMGTQQIGKIISTEDLARNAADQNVGGNR